MGIAERKLKQKEELKARILITAWQLVKEEGWQSLSIRKIADAIEYSVSVIYEHFGSKEAILLEFGKEGFGLLAKKILKAKEKSNDPAEQLKNIANAYWNFASTNKEYYQLMFGLGMPGCELEKCIPERANFRKLIMEPISELIEKSKNPDINPCLKYYTFWSILHGLNSIKMMENTGVSNELNKMVMEDAIAGFIKNLG
ncbi:TetR/AcrR family transcriptional regulator [Chitinophagaceae bacterium LB-8]|uniref:TetR/AcrR family transcriptional regulator n=1 Tax=Paraflavisolibacter caeni TaxID=2982496 RepID=A0A9X2XMS3_9BACT|nr:TetR/AcrR family transcriptional regulator [Paraflavisolibacter caeni]MCU7547768.1 TetR/AcrR family transcriptional regulator [Paraflavisolibacter caeni]